MRLRTHAKKIDSGGKKKLANTLTALVVQTDAPNDFNSVVNSSASTDAWTAALNVNVSALIAPCALSVGITTPAAVPGMQTMYVRHVSAYVD